jgi:hypothetical protein
MLMLQSKTYRKLKKIILAQIKQQQMYETNEVTREKSLTLPRKKK